MSSDYIPRLRAELLRAGAAQQRRSRWASVGRPLLPALDRLRPSPQTLVALAVVLALVAAVLTVSREADVQRPVAAPGKKVVTRLRDGLRFSLDGRVLTVQLLPSARRGIIRRVSGVRTSVTCGAKGASPPSQSGTTTLTQHWPAGQRSLSYRFRRDVSEWCRLEDPVGRSVAFVVFPGAGALAAINDVANAWLRPLQLGLNFYGECPPDKVPNQGACEAMWVWVAVQEIAINGDRAAVRFSNGKTIELQRDANGVWLLGRFGEHAGRGFFK